MSDSPAELDGGEHQGPHERADIHRQPDHGHLSGALSPCQSAGIRRPRVELAAGNGPGLVNTAYARQQQGARSLLLQQIHCRQGAARFAFGDDRGEVEGSAAVTTTQEARDIEDFRRRAGHDRAAAVRAALAAADLDALHRLLQSAVEQQLGVGSHQRGALGAVGGEQPVAQHQGNAEQIVLGQWIGQPPLQRLATALDAVAPDLSAILTTEAWLRHLRLRSRVGGDARGACTGAAEKAGFRSPLQACSGSGDWSG